MKKTRKLKLDLFKTWCHTINQDNISTHCKVYGELLNCRKFLSHTSLKNQQNKLHIYWLNTRHQDYISTNYKKVAKNTVHALMFVTSTGHNSIKKKINRHDVLFHYMTKYETIGTISNQFKIVLKTVYWNLLSKRGFVH